MLAMMDRRTLGMPNVASDQTMIREKRNRMTAHTRYTQCRRRTFQYHSGGRWEVEGEQAYGWYNTANAGAQFTYVPKVATKE